MLRPDLWVACHCLLWMLRDDVEKANITFVRIPDDKTKRGVNLFQSETSI